jgi:hypothetical protein
VVGHGHRRHAQPLHLGEQRFELGCPVEHGVLSVHVQVDEVRQGRPFPRPVAWSTRPLEVMRRAPGSRTGRG